MIILIWVVGHCEQVEMSTLEKKCHHQGHQFKNNFLVLFSHVDPSCFEIRFIKAILTTEVIDQSNPKLTTLLPASGILKLILLLSLRPTIDRDTAWDSAHRRKTPRLGRMYGVGRRTRFRSKITRFQAPNAQALFTLQLPIHI